MRYIGNKESILNEIERLIVDKNLDETCTTFFDAFSGTATVGENYKNKFKIISNDNMYFSFVYSLGRLNYPKTKFNKLIVDPFDYFNQNELGLNGFICKNYSQGGSERMYFSTENAARIDFIRWQIEEWKKQQLITDEYYHIYGKTFGANSKEIALLCFSLSVITDKLIKLFQILDNDSISLGKDDISAIESMNKIEILDDSYRFDNDPTEKDNIADDLRSPKFVYNLLTKIGKKKCCLCDCEIDSIIQAAHI